MKELPTYLIAVAGLIGTPAFAADMAVKAPPPTPAPVFSWTGFYVGGNVGYGWGQSSNTLNAFAPTGAGDTICQSSSSAFGALCVNGSESNNLNGAIGGLQAGYNFQSGKLLAGVEADFQMSGQNGGGSFTRNLLLAGPSTETQTGTDSERISWFGTVRGRLGITFDRWLVYSTGGLAYGRVTNNGSATVTAFFCPDNTPPTVVACPLSSWSSSSINAGWTLGGGVEAALSNSWSVKAEYLYVDLGTVNTNFTTNPVCAAFVESGGGGGGCTGEAAGTGTIGGRVTLNILRVGLNYRFY
jgi:outer membrane immunogenic protein